MENYVLLIVGLLILANTLISLKISKRDDFEVSQKATQITLVWLFPLVGCAGVWLLYKSIDKPIPKPESFAKRSEGNSSWQDTP